MTDDPFVTHRSLLFTVAYEMLGSAADAEDVVQETWLRWAEVDQAEVVADPLDVRQAVRASRSVEVVDGEADAGEAGGSHRLSTSAMASRLRSAAGELSFTPPRPTPPPRVRRARGRSGSAFSPPASRPAGAVAHARARP